MLKAAEFTERERVEDRPAYRRCSLSACKKIEMLRLYFNIQHAQSLTTICNLRGMCSLEWASLGDITLESQALLLIMDYGTFRSVSPRHNL